MLRRLLLIAPLLMLAAGPLAAQPKPAAPPPGAQNSSFNLVNRASQPIRELFVTSAGNAGWGQNRLDGKNGAAVSIPPGASYAVRRRLDTNCIFDIRVVYADGKPEERKGVNTCAVEEVAVGAVASNLPLAATGKPADDPSFRLFNRSARNIVEFRAAPAGGSEAGENRLATPLPPDKGQMIGFKRDGQCIFDLRVVFADGKAMEKKRANLCKTTELPVP